jgi:hypothetical protein
VGSVEKGTRDLGIEVSESAEKLYHVRPFHFIIVGLEELESAEAEKLVGVICERLLKEEAQISTISALMVIGYFDSRATYAESRERVVHALLQDNGEKVRILYGQMNGVIGHLGSSHRFSYGPFISGFEEIREQLEKVTFGLAAEFRAPN